MYQLCGTDCRIDTLHDTIQHSCCVKRFDAYETIRWLFTEITGETVEFSVTQRIWGLIVEVINVIAEFIACDPFALIENVIKNNNQIRAVKQAFDRLELSESTA